MSLKQGEPRRVALLNEAVERVMRGSDEYGTVENNFGLIADLWNAYLSKIPRQSLKPVDVAAMMILLKIARSATGGQKADTWLDIAGYAACAAELPEGDSHES